MRAALFPLVALCACVMAVASTDPEVTLPGVSDLSEWPWLAIAADQLGGPINQTAGLLNEHRPYLLKE
jgi:hypothetical protein